MRYVAAALLTALAGQEINAANIEKILSSVGVEVDKANLDIVVKEMAGKSVEELIAAGSTKLASMPSGKLKSFSFFSSTGMKALAEPIFLVSTLNYTTANIIHN